MGRWGKKETKYTARRRRSRKPPSRAEGAHAETTMAEQEQPRNPRTTQDPPSLLRDEDDDEFKSNCVNDLIKIDSVICDDVVLVIRALKSSLTVGVDNIPSFTIKE
ncbi:hypothetical protein AVEN_263643-1 [Araneus ventricosus]|uniref:Uncharacterized protein n=1 Tax=Araneus ventricosus TaxID=182803 RepID=A0A4Y2ATU3_ARAVE|nr:hypothetical protein AVEN_263643-1 [Araneus ventricosus]